MRKMPAPISKDDAASAIVFGFAILGMVVIITWRWLLE